MCANGFCLSTKHKAPATDHDTDAQAVACRQLRRICCEHFSTGSLHGHLQLCKWYANLLPCESLVLGHLKPQPYLPCSRCQTLIHMCLSTNPRHATKSTAAGGNRTMTMFRWRSQVWLSAGQDHRCMLSVCVCHLFAVCKSPCEMRPAALGAIPECKSTTVISALCTWHCLSGLILPWYGKQLQYAFWQHTPGH